MKLSSASQRSPILSTVVTAIAVLVMLTPLRRGEVKAESRHAGWVPLLNLGGLRDTAAFQRRASSPSGFAASSEPVSRSASSGTQRTP